MNSVPTLRLEGQDTTPAVGAAKRKVLSAVAAVGNVTTAITGVAGSRIQLVAFALSTDTAGALSIRDSEGSPTTYLTEYHAANGTGTLQMLPPGQFTLPSGSGLVLHHAGSATGAFTGTLYYNLQPV